MFFLEMVMFILKWVNLQKMVRNQTKICPGKKFVTNEYPGMCIYNQCQSLIPCKKTLSWLVDNPIDAKRLKN